MGLRRRVIDQKRIRVMQEHRTRNKKKIVQYTDEYV